MRVKLSLSAILIVLLLFLSFSNGKSVVLEAEDVKDEREFKAVWMSTFVGEAPYSSESQFKSYMNGALDVFEYYGLNAVIFHVRTHNNAFYPSNINPRASWWSSVNFEVFDPIGWLIEESHKRGIEFHAWMNPYRVSTGRSYQTGEVPLSNPQNNPDNLIIEGNTTILNPAKPEVREHIYNTILEFSELYPTVDAIHFDDYFYISTNAQPIDSVQRRQQVDLLIEGIHDVLSLFNEENNTAIQFGISPTGIYRNGNGEVTYDENGLPITNGSNTNGFQHYGDYLYADTLKWAINGWIDYLLPQTYWATNHSSASYIRLTDWWNKVFKNLDVNLYSGIGVYMANNSGTFNWANDPNEMNSQLELLDTLEHIKGYSIYSYKHLANGYNNTNNKSGEQIRNAYETDARRDIKIPPEIKTIPKIEVPPVSNIKIDDGVLSWDKVENGKFYYIYYNKTKVTYSTDEIVGVIGQESQTMTFDVENFDSGNFSVRVISRTNHLSPLLNEEDVLVTFKLNDLANSEIITKGTKISEPSEPNKEGYLFLGWYNGEQLYDFNNIVNENITLTAKWEKIIYYFNLTLHYGYDSIVETLQVEEHTIPVKPLKPTREGYSFVGWFFNDQEFLFNEPLKRNITLVAVWEVKTLEVEFNYNYEDINVNKQIPYGANIKEIETPLRTGYKFLGWYLNDELYLFNTPVYDDIVLTAKWEEITYYDVVFNFENEETIITVAKDSLVDKIEEPQKDGYLFIGWYKGNELFDFNSPITENISLQATFGVKVVFDYGYVEEFIIARENSKVLEPFTPNKDGYIFKGWYKDDVLFSFTESITEPITLNALYETIDNLENISVYKDTNIRLIKNKEALVYHAVIEKSKSNLEHGFYLVYGRVSYSEMLNQINENDSTIYINDKKVFKVIVNGTKEDSTFSVVITGIPHDSFDDVITVIPYFVSENGNITIAEIFKISSINNARKQINTNVNINLYCLKEDLKRKDNLMI